MYDEPVIDTVVPSRDAYSQRSIRQLLDVSGLGYEDDIELFVVARSGMEIVACMGLAGNVVKCTAIRESFQGHNLAARMTEEMSYVALDRGRPHLFMFTKPQYRETFEACGFHTLAEVRPLAVLLENTPNGIRRYAEELELTRFERGRVAGIVVNANPFTRGHQYLIRTAAQECDFVHVFVVREDASMFSYDDRLALVKAGVGEIPEHDKVLVHPGSEYIVSRATFPSYFLKDDADLNRAATGIDLQLFRTWIAPALSIRHRYVGTEPFSAITNLYNDEMHRWLERAPMAAPPIEVHVVPRLSVEGETTAISATEIRRLISEGRLDRIAELVPGPTLDLIKEKYAQALTVPVG